MPWLGPRNRPVHVAVTGLGSGEQFFRTSVAVDASPAVTSGGPNATSVICTGGVHAGGTGSATAVVAGAAINPSAARTMPTMSRTVILLRRPPARMARRRTHCFTNRHLAVDRRPRRGAAAAARQRPCPTVVPCADAKVWYGSGAKPCSFLVAQVDTRRWADIRH